MGPFLFGETLGFQSAGKAGQMIADTLSAIQLRREGLTIAEIAGQLGLSYSTTNSYLKNALSRIGSQDVDEWRGLELERIEALHRSLWGAALDGDVKAIDRVIALMSARSKLLGLNALPKENDKRTSDDGTKILEVQLQHPTPDGEQRALPAPSEGVER